MGVVNSRTPINDRQVELLERIAGGTTLGDASDAALRRSAYALRDRGLVEISKRGGVFTAVITDRGRFYLDHDHYPDEPSAAATASGRSTANEASGATVEERELVERLAAAENKTVTVEDPDPESRAAYRRAVHGIKQHGLVPEGFVLRHTGRAGGDMVIRLLDAESPDETDWNRVRLNLRKPAPKALDLGQLLDENPAAVSVSDGQRQRARQFLLDLAAEAARRGHLVKLARRGRYAKLGYAIGGAQRSLMLSEEYDQVTQQPPAGRSRRYTAWQYPTTERVPSGRLKLEIGRADWGKSDTWVDDKRSTLEKRIRQIVRQVQAGFDEDEQARLEARRRWEEQQAELERQRAAERIEWQAAMDRARPKAVAVLRRATLVAALNAWRDARDLREICAVLDLAAGAAADDGQRELAENLAAWREQGLAIADEVDPTRGTASLGNLDIALQPAPDDLRPYLDGWSPDGPHRDYYGSRERKPSRPWPAEWQRLRR